MKPSGDGRQRLQAARRWGEGFTLLEVLAAVVLLGLAFAMLASAAIQSLSAEGEAVRRLEASELADARLAAIEAAIESGTLPPPGIQEEETGDYRVRLEVEALPWPEAQAASSPALAPAPEMAARGRGASGNEQLRPRLLRVRVRVRWTEGRETAEVTRVSFAVDPGRLAAALEALRPAGGTAGASR